jgi:hypothetical protein
MEEIIIPVVAILMPLFLVPTIIVLKHRHGRREWEHLERMKAMEIGMAPPAGTGPSDSKALLPIGAGVPIASVAAAFLTCAEGPPEVQGVPLAAVAWGCAVVISAGAMITSLIMAFLLGRSRVRADSSQVIGHAKPAYDPDAFDVVGSRA